MSEAQTELEILRAKSQLEWYDILVIVAYFAVVIGVGIWSSCRNRGSAKGYFLAGKSMHWIPVGASLFASNIGSGHFVGLAGSGAASGIGIAVFEFSATYILLLLGWVFVPVYIAAGVFTMPEYLRKRFGGQRIQIYLAVLSLLLYILTKVSADLFSGSIFLQQAIGLNEYISSIIFLFLAMVFTVAGGLSAVIWTDFAQTIIMLLGAAALCILSFNEVGGYTNVMEQFLTSVTQSNQTRLCLSGAINDSFCAVAEKCGVVPDNSLNTFRAATDPALPWPGIVFGLTISSIWYWCSDQYFGENVCINGSRSGVEAPGKQPLAKPSTCPAVWSCIYYLACIGVVSGMNSFVEVGKDSSFGSPFEALTNRYFAAYSVESVISNRTCNTPPDFSMNIMRPATLTNDLPWTGVVFGLLISSLWYWCTDQVIVQRALAAKNLSHAKAGTVLAGFLKFTPLWLLVFPGMIARILFPDSVGCGSEEACEKVCENKAGCTNIAYPLLVLKLMPGGARGLMIAVMMSALMSSLTSIFNSGSTIFTMDIWTKVRKQATEMELLVVGRVFVVALAGVSVAWIPVLKSFSELFHYIQQMTSYLAPPVCAVYVLGVAWKRVNEQGAFWGLMVGFVVGMIRAVLEVFVYPAPAPCSLEESTVPDVIAKVHYLHFGCILFVISAVVIIVISLLTKPINPKKLLRLTFMSRFEEGERLDQSADDDNPVPQHIEMLDQSKESVVASTAKLAENDDDDDENLPWYRIAINWICGIEKQSAPEMTDEEKAALEAKNLSLEEVPKWRRINNFAAIILIVVTTFIWAYFG